MRYTYISASQNASVDDVILEQNDYLPFGTKVAGSSQPSLSANRYRYAGKEEQRIGSFNSQLLDFGARYYDAYTCRWGSTDPLAHKYFGLSPYNYCGNDPVNRVDPDGTYVKVCDNGNGTYTVVGGELDGDMNIYVYTQDKDGEYTVRGESIGETATPYTFYDSDPNNDGSGPKGWAVGAVIDPNDNSGIDFLNEATDPSVSLLKYMWNARGGKVWDFKLANLPEKADVHNYVNRGLPLGQNTLGKTVYASARDIGNIAAGKMAGMHGYSWESTSAGTDTYQMFQCAINFVQIRREGPSTKYAQHLGWNMSKMSNVCQIKK